MGEKNRNENSACLGRAQGEVVLFPRVAPALPESLCFHFLSVFSVSVV